jgi:hypothetical protein
MELCCAACDYDLRIVPESGRCPECGFSVDESIRLRGGWTKRRLMALCATVIAYLIGVATWGAFEVMIVTKRDPSQGIRSLVAALLALHCVAISIAAIAGTYAASRQARGWRIAVVSGLALVVAITGALVVMGLVGGPRLAGFSMDLVLTCAAFSRVLVMSMASWWLIRAHQSLHRRWTRASIAAIVALGLTIAAWLMLGIWAYRHVVPHDGQLAIGFDLVASLVIVGVGVSAWREARTRLSLLRVSPE